MLQNNCRICSQEVDVSKKNTLNLFEKKSRKLLDQIKLLTGVLLEPNGLQELICERCQLDLKNAIEFRKRCLNCQGPQKRILRANKLKRCAIEANDEEAIASDADIRDPLSEDKFENLNTDLQLKDEAIRDKDVANNSDQTVNLISKIENGNPNKKLELELKVSRGRRKKCPNRVVPVKEDKEIEDCSEHSNKDNASDSDSGSDRFKDESRGVKSEVKELNGKRRKSTKTKLVVPTFFCDVCGSNIMGKSTFERHIRSHNNIRPYQCQHCPSAFFSTGELKGHQVKHTGERNYPCRYCERTFAGSSHRHRHELTHSNERPFQCSQCEKTFVGRHHLRYHLYIHTGKRMFRCDLCNRDFLRRTHLNTHYRSNAHKRNEEKQNGINCEKEIPSTIS